MANFLKRMLSYNGSMEYIELNDQDIVDNYQHEFVVDYYRPHIEGKKVLDAGCWTGPLEKTITKKNIQTDLTGIDENDDALSVARRNFPHFSFEQCQLMSGNEEFVAKHQGTFDTVIFLDVIEHVPKGKEVVALQFFRKLLKPDGVLIVSTMRSHFLNPIDPAWMLGHRHYSKKNLESILSGAGFGVVENQEIGNLYWDLDMLYFYICKHIFRTPYNTSQKMRERILKGLKGSLVPTRFYLKAQKKT